MIVNQSAMSYANEAHEGLFCRMLFREVKDNN